MSYMKTKNSDIGGVTIIKNYIETVKDLPKITVVDAPCGKGKTEYAIQYMKDNIEDKRFMFITPYLNEVSRIIKNIPSFKEPTTDNGKKKWQSIRDLLISGENIVSTHSLFLNFNDDIKDLIISNGYTLILDEVVNCVESLGAGKDALNLLIENELISVDSETHLIKWNDDKPLLEVNREFTKYQQAIKSRDCYEIRNSAILWTIDPSVFVMFKEVFILTYLFSGQQQRYLFDACGIKWDVKQVIPTEDTQDNVYPNIIYKLTSNYKYDMSIYKDLINIYNGKLNSIGENTSLSSSWYYKANKSKLKHVENFMNNYFKNINKSKAKDRIWTIQEDYRTKIQSVYSKQHVAINCRGTNDYQSIHNLAYMSNRFMNPMTKAFFTDICKVRVFDDEWALSELIQWVFRSGVRNDEKINLYLPSKRMRDLLEGWMVR